MTAWRRALIFLPALAACYAYAPPRGWAANRPEAAALEREPDAEPPPLGDVSEARLRIVETARQYLGGRFADDCSSFVRRVMREAGVELGPLPSARTMSESLHLVSRDVKVPRPGDLIFFHDTFDRNRDGKLGDRWTHVALVEAVEGSRVWILHRGGKGIIRLRMDRARPHDDDANDKIRKRTRKDPPGTRYLTSELFAGYGAVVE
jgi:hypothetical protein